MTPEHFWSRVDKPVEGCWEWQGNRDIRGYGRLWISGVCIRTHRYSYALHFGDIPEGAYICHHCDNPPCVNPSHLYAGTPASNTADMVRRGRNREGVASPGERNASARVTAAAVADIRAAHARGTTQRELCIRFGISKAQMSRIVNRKHWRHIA